MLAEHEPGANHNSATLFVTPGRKPGLGPCLHWNHSAHGSTETKRLGMGRNESAVFSQPVAMRPKCLISYQPENGPAQNNDVLVAHPLLDVIAGYPLSRAQAPSRRSRAKGRNRLCVLPWMPGSSPLLSGRFFWTWRMALILRRFQMARTFRTRYGATLTRHWLVPPPASFISPFPSRGRVGKRRTTSRRRGAGS